MSTEASGLPEPKGLRFFRGKTHPLMSSVHLREDDRRISGHVREIAERSLEPGEVVYEAIRATEGDLLRKLVAAHKRCRDLDAEWTLRGGPDADGLIAAIARAKDALREALDALLAVAPHWGGGE